MPEPKSLTLAIDARPFVGAGATVELTVNETTLPPRVLSADRQEYRWQVPKEILRAGMNRVWLGVSQLERPSDLDSTSTDDRRLGLAVWRIRLLELAQ